MKNTGIVYSSAEKTPVILPEFAGLLPPLTGEQSALLEQDLIQNGCIAPIVVNEDLAIVDGHNRHALCVKHSIPYNMMVFHFEDTLEAMRWAVDTQKGRRNLDKWELGKIALKLKPEVEARAKANMSAGGGDQKSQEVQTRVETPSLADTGQTGNAGSGCRVPNNPISHRVDTRQELADSVGITRDAMNKVIKIDETAPQAVRDALDNKEISVNRGYEITRQVQDLPEEEREQAAETALAMQKAAEKLKKGDEEIDRKTKTAQSFSKLYTALLHLEDTEEAVNCWVECCRMSPLQIKNNAALTRDFQEKFARIAGLLEAKLPPEYRQDSGSDHDGDTSGGSHE